MTKREWNDAWWVEFHLLRHETPDVDIKVVQAQASAHMLKQYGPCPDDELGIKDKIVLALALRWLRGKLEDLRGSLKETGMGKVLKFLDGWKLIIGVAILFGAKLWDGAHNGHTGDIVGNFLNIMGWLPGVQSGFTPEGITVAAASGLALFGFVMKLVKAGQQAHAGAPISGLLSEEGYVAVAQKDAGHVVTGELVSAPRLAPTEPPASGGGDVKPKP